MNTNDFIICIRWEQTTWNTAATKGFIALDYWDWHHSWQWNYDQTRVKLEAGGRSRDFENKFRSNMKDVEVQKNLSTATQNTRGILNISWGWGDGQKVQEDSYKCWEKSAENEGCECGICGKTMHRRDLLGGKTGLLSEKWSQKLEGWVRKWWLNRTGVTAKQRYCLLWPKSGRKKQKK